MRLKRDLLGREIRVDIWIYQQRFTQSKSSTKQKPPYSTIRKDIEKSSQYIAFYKAKVVIL